MSFVPDALYLLFAFLCGSIPFSWIIGKMKGVEIRNFGSGNPGATNLLRVCGRSAGVTGLVFDVTKGALPVAFVLYWMPFGDVSSPYLVGAFTALLAVLGHVFCPWFGFRGGKGVATFLGVLIVLSPYTVLSASVIFVIVVSIFRYISLGSITASAVLIPGVFIFESGSKYLPVQIFVCVVAVLVILRHLGNIRKILNGEENRFSFRKAER